MTATPTEREAESTWTRLRRRKVVQWGVVYVAAAWGFLQGLEYVSEAFHWPDQLRQVALLLLLIGLPIVLVLAWYHGDRGQQRISTPEFAILTLLLLLGGGAFWYYQRVSEAGKVTPSAASAIQPTTSPAVADPRPSVAVLPFENRSPEADDAYFVDGIHDDILTQLSKVSALRVISRTSVEQFRETKLPMKAIADQLGVTKILEGGVQRGGERVRINVQLIDANRDAHVWAETYDRELTAANIFAIQSEVAAAIAGALQTTLTASEKERIDTVPTRNLKAWEAYQLGRQRQARRASDSLDEAERFLRRAIDLDPQFALAYAALADTLSLQVDYSGKSPDITYAEADKAAAKALELDPNLAEAWVASGGVAMGLAQGEAVAKALELYPSLMQVRAPNREIAMSPPGAVAELFLRRAIELNPNNATAHHWLSMVLRDNGRLQDELEHAKRAVQLDPLSAVTNSNFGDSLSRAGRFNETGAHYQRAIEIDPALPGPWDGLAFLKAYGRNRFVDAVPLQERAVALDPGNGRWSSALANLRLDLGDEVQATRLIATVSRRWPDDVFANHYSAGVMAALGNSGAAERHAAKALAVYPRDSVSLAIVRNADLGRGDPKAARARYASAFPELLSTTPLVNTSNCIAALDLALVLQGTGELARASTLLDASENQIRGLARLGWSGYGIADAQIYALRGQKTQALAALRGAVQVGWRGPFWRYFRDFDPALSSIRNEPEFKAIFADIERDMARQRAALAARPKDAPLELTSESE